MKPRLIFWMMLTVATTAMVLIVLFHRSAMPPARPKTQNQSTSTVAQPVAKTPSTTVASPQPAASTAQTEKQPPSIAQAVVNEQKGYWQRHEAILALASGKLNDSDREILFNFLRQHTAGDDGQQGQALKSLLLDVLCTMQPPPQGLGELLAQIYHDSGQNTVLQDYAVQHMAAYYRQMTAATGVDDQIRSDELKQTQQLLWDASNNTGSSIAGTALLGMSRLSQEGLPGFDQNKIADKALDLAGQYGDELTRITAIQVCASLNIKFALPIVLGAAEQGETESVKISAIGALGSLGGSGQIPFLNTVLQGNDDRLKPPAQQALNRLKQRLGS